MWLCVAEVHFYGYRTEDFGLSSCKAGARISSAAGCETAAGAMGLKFESSGSWGDSPGGCQIELGSKAMRFNMDVDGSGSQEYSPVCLLSGAVGWMGVVGCGRGGAVGIGFEEDG